MVSLVDERLSCEGQSDNHLVVIAADHLIASLWLGSLLVHFYQQHAIPLGYHVDILTHRMIRGRQSFMNTSRRNDIS